MTDIFKQQRPNINLNEFDGGGTDDEVEVDSMRAMLHGGVQGNVPQGPPPPVQMTGSVPPQVKAAMQQQQFASHPLQNQVEEEPVQLNDATAMYANARKLMKQAQNPQEAPQQPVFSPNFTQPSPAQMVQQNKYQSFKDANYEAIIGKLVSVKYEEIELPSKGKFYLRGEGPSNGILHVRPMTGAEEQIISNTRLIKKNQTLNVLFKECIGEQINPELLLAEDRTYILIFLRGISYSTAYDVEVKCPECQKISQQKIHLNMLDVDYCPDDFGPEDLEDTLPNSGLKIKYRLSTVRDEATVQEYRDKKIKDFGADVNDDTSMFRSALLLEEVQGVTNKLMIKEIVSRLPIGDTAYLRELLNEPPFGVDTKVGILCPFCAHEFRVDMPMELGFFFPKPSLPKKKQRRV